MKTKKIAILLLLPLLAACFLSVGQSQAHTVPILNDDLILYYNLNEGSGSIAIDQSGNNYHGVINNAVFENGVYGDSLYFDGTNDFINTSNVNVTNSFTISAWMKLNETSEWMLFSKGYVSANDFYVYNDVSTTLNQKIYNNEGSGRVNEFNTTLLNSWVHIVTIYESGQTLKCYINNTVTTGAILDSFGFNNDDLHIGMFETTDVYDFKGWIDEFRIYNGTLNASEIQYLYEGEPDAAPTITPFPEGDMGDTDWWISILVLLLIIINIFLMMLPFALVRFTFGILSLFLCMLALSYQIPLSPYLQTAGLLISALAMLFSVRARE